MQHTISLEEQAAQPIDEATRAALEQARAELQRGEGVTLEQARKTVDQQYQAWLKIQREVLAR